LTKQSQNVYFLGKLIYAEGNSVTTDRLGSVRSGGPGGLGYQAEYPYGVEYTATANDREKYATYTRDSVTGLDYAMNRYYSSQWGRFLSPDSSGANISLVNPQSWHGYAYVGGDPANSNDPSGLIGLPPDGPPGDPGGSGPGFGINPGGGGWGFGFGGGSGCDGLPDPGNWYDGGSGLAPWTFGPLPPWCGQGFLPWGWGGSGAGGGTGGPPAPCNSAIMQPQYLSIFAQMGTALGVNPMFIMAVSLQESGWGLSHVYGTNSSSNGQPLNNLFGSTNAGGNNIAYPSVQASATAWEQNWGSYLSNGPTTIQAFVGDLLSNPNHMYNSSADWPISIEGGTLSNGKSTSGTYNTLVREFSACKAQFP
jgi:RHS repeat-associated protein